MKVALDLSSLSGRKLTGVGVYITNLIESLRKIKVLDLSCVYKISRIKNSGVIKERTKLPVNLPYVPYLYELFPKPYSIFHGPDYWIPASKSIKKVVTIHDFSVFHDGLWSKEFAEYGKSRLSEVLNKHRPDQIIVVSDFVKAELLNRFPEQAEITSTVYHGADHFGVNLVQSRHFDFPYILCVGTVEVRKNTLRLAKAFEKVSVSFPDVKLVFAGGTGGFQGKEIAQDLNKIKNLINLDYIASETMQNLITHAEFVAYPSVYEGFGFPILEAMHLGTAVLTSNFGAMKEIAGGKAFLVNTLDINELAMGLEELLRNESLRKRLAIDGVGYVKGFTWKKSAFETAQVYKNV